MDWFSWVDDVFGGGSGTSVQGSPPVDAGSAPIMRWAIGQCFAAAGVNAGPFFGPIIQYVGMLPGNPGVNIPSAGIPEPFKDNNRPNTGMSGLGRTDDVNNGEIFDLTQMTGNDPGDGSSPPPAQPAENRTIERLDRGDSAVSPAGPTGPVDVVNVFGSPRNQSKSSGNDWFPGFQQYERQESLPGFRFDFPTPRRSPRRSPVRHFSSEDIPDVIIGPPPPPPEPVKSEPERPENIPSPRLERADTGKIENIPTVPIERTFWSRGGTGLTLGAAAAAGGVAILVFSNPVGWVAGGVALAIAGGVAATSASAVELGASYGGATSPEQDAEMNRAVSATLGYTSIGGVIGSVAGTVMADNAQEGFEKGAMWGGLTEGGVGIATSLPGAVRALPGLWRAGVPYARGLVLTPLWGHMAGGGVGGGSTRSMARLFAAQGRMASRGPRVEYLGKIPLLERDAAWARYQIGVTGTHNEGVFRITYADGQVRIVQADRFMQRSRNILEAKYGDMGQMWIPEREAHIIRQANNYLDITRATGGNVRYYVSTELGASRLTQRFQLEFPGAMKSNQLTVEWKPW
jgi:hypothetical protein